MYIVEIQSYCRSLPFVIILDPHGNGNNARNLFMPGADQLSAVIAASNSIKNNTSGYNAVLQMLIADIKKKYPFIGK